MAPRKAKNTNRQGANFELQIMAHLKERGYDVLRSSGSRGKIDVVALGDDFILLIQAKISNPLLSPADRRAVRDVAARGGSVNNLPVVAYRVNGRVCFRLLTGDGPNQWTMFKPPVQARAVCACGHVGHEHALLGDTCCWFPLSAVGPICSCQGWTAPPKTPKTEGTAS